MNILDEKEINLIDELTNKYNELIKPSKLSLLTTKIKDLIPDKVTDLKNNITENINETKLITDTINVINTGFTSLSKEISKYTLTKEQIINRLNKKYDKKITKLEEICLLKSYDISNVVKSNKKENITLSLIEGAGTGAIGLVGIPFNLALSTLLYFRTIESIAMHYGYDINDPAELIIVSDVYKCAITKNTSEIIDDTSNVITKILVLNKSEAFKHASNKSWEYLAKNSSTKLVTKLRALANKSAANALNKAKEKGLEESVFKDTLTEVGKKLPKEKLKKLGIITSSIFTGVIDAKEMNYIIDYADTFYQKRFILEKEERVKRLHKNYKLYIIIITLILLIILTIIIVR